jgi:exosortase/archaeosortase family protein
MAAELNARVGRTTPSPMFGVLVDARSPAIPSAPPTARRLPRVAWLLGALLAALWPHWIYMARRTFDGSDEPWGVLALVTVLVLLAREHRALVVPTRAALVASGALAIAAAGASMWLPSLAAAAIAMLALAVFVVHALPHRPGSALAALLLLALPVIASLQFYLGFPLRAFTAQAVARLLGVAGFDASASGASLLFRGNTVLVDAPCAGIGMLWVGSYTAALLSYLQRADAARTALNALVAALLVLVANVARNGALFFPEAGLVHWPAWSHEAIGLAAFALAIVPLAAFIHRTRP